VHRRASGLDHGWSYAFFKAALAIFFIPHVTKVASEARRNKACRFRGGSFDEHIEGRKGDITCESW
jgi:hypothetical protein